MILADTSVWIDFFAGRQTTQVDLLKQALVAGQVLIGDLILVELLQGPRHQRDVMRLERAFAGLPVEPLCGSVIAPIAAANYRRLRRSGVTPRGTVDVIIATWCIQCAVPLLHNDRDYLVMEKELGLASASSV
ncbi:MAG: PIN domain nuclease [Hoeflea sp.]|uniref:type II toxin-antitoxin system VapC family toxin n=1 Tax=Hoeflea sp. TaxID=1940281 RepID=UPI001D2B1008|nr:PIN domain nuclease [Hoeflea sp.]MBU4530097.1 PIN domain nuclease [Alphaproteobacteria bacterium]MBU4542618.1 PIN domain nuclease [Alphaproteobacteria bacterium]MBU4551299.1 PIN domain nuclease [Alphaproteobacteria bacterium]MBV1723122.1 PIN domain nuclease [Hoeflea sp.]MBV1760133.1 PIN domain nuclease [Hoeflea sp.]